MIIAIASILFHLKPNELAIPEETISNGSIDSYTQNLSASGSHYEKSPAFGKGDELEVVYVITPESSLNFLADFRKLKDWLNIETIDMNGEKTSPNVLDTPVSGSGTTVLKIRGHSKQPSNTDSALTDESVSIEFT